MDSLIQNILTLSGSESGLQLLQQKKLKDVNKLLSKNKSSLRNALESLDPLTHSLGYMSILNYVSNHTDLPNSPHFLQLTKIFLLNCDADQIQRDSFKFSNIAVRFGTMLFEQAPKFAILPLRNAINVLQRESPHLLTAVHPIFVLCCIKAQCYHAALPIVQRPVYEVHTAEKTPFDPKSNLLYHYYSASIFIAFRKHELALDCLQMALTAPSLALSEIQIESYKKYVLLSLYIHGRLVELPSFTCPSIYRHVAKLCEPYTSLAEAYAKGVLQLEECIQLHKDDFVKDENYGLVQQVLRRLVRRNIKNLTDTYITLSVDAIAEMAKTKDARQAEDYILSMIEEGGIFAKIDQQNGMVSFLGDDEDYATQEMISNLDTNIHDIMSFWRRVQQVNEEVSLDPKYINKTLKQNQNVDQEMLLAQQLSLADKDTQMPMFR
uniref:COP9 signalosome complex subunit 3 n=1 Tax=Hirondellea gigas TaxID=1518452 RepID=A0A6A7GAM0_9CRUS